MGSGSSRQTLYLGDLKQEVISAKTSAELSKTILTAFFTTADLKDLLTLTKIGDCNKYVWLTAGVLNSTFSTMKVEPRPGEKQEILYAPIDKVLGAGAPERVRSCINVAYNHVRVFQIYAALAMTVMDAIPTRPTIDISSVSAAKEKAKPAGWMLQRGGVRQPLDEARKRAIGTLADLLRIPELSITKDTYGSETIIRIQPQRGEAPGEEGRVPHIDFMANAVDVQGDGMTRVEAYFSAGRSEDKKFDLAFNKQGSGQYILLVNGIVVDTFLVVELSRLKGTQIRNVEELFTKIGDILKGVADQGYVSQTSAYTGSIGSTASAASAASAAPVRAVGSQDELLRGYANIRKVFTDYMPSPGIDGKVPAPKSFPKAYCIARAMTLLNPIFESERRDKFRSQICSGFLDFETERFMPQPGNRPSENKYFKSLYALYYDDFEVSGGKIISKQTESGRTELIQASRDMAVLFGFNPSDNFFESAQVIQPRSKICPSRAQAGLQANQTILLDIESEPFRRRLQGEIITPMITFQKQHAVKVNALLSTMIKVTPKGEFTFTSAAVQGGRKALDEFGKKARELLRQYYIKSEILYKSGIEMFEKAPSGAFLSKVYTN